jgi:hypothetical protein
MAQTITPITESPRTFSERNLRAVPPAPIRTVIPLYQAHRMLRVAFTIAPVVAGFDKFFHGLVNWDKYLAPQINNLLGGRGHDFMLAVGVIEIVAGLGVALRPKIFAYVVSAWLLGIVINLLMTGDFYDIALRDFGLAMAAYALGRLSQAMESAAP